MNGTKHRIYCSTYCNFGHYVDTGRPVSHECRIIPPHALALEMEGDYKGAIEILQAIRPIHVHGRRRQL